MPVGTYKTEDGISFSIEEEGVVAEVIESETEEKEEASEEVEAAEDEAAEDVGDWEGMEKRIQNLEIRSCGLEARSKEGGDDDVEASEEMTEEATEPSTNPKTITTKEVKEFSVEELKAENEKLKTELAEQPAECSYKYK